MKPSDIPAQINELLEYVQTLQNKLKARPTEEFSRTDAGYVAQLAKAVKELSAEARQWENALRNQAEHATLDEKCNAVINFLMSLNKVDRNRVLNKVKDLTRRDRTMADASSAE